MELVHGMHAYLRTTLYRVKNRQNFIEQEPTKGATYQYSNMNYSIVMIGIFTSIGCQIGDLFFSFLKRKAKIKDTGNFFPGHGGVLDRLDGIFFGIPTGYLSLILFY